MAHEIVIPRLGWSMEEGTFVGWLKRDGDTVKRGEAVFELEGEKASQDIEAVDEGILRIPPNGPQPGSVLKVGAVVGYLVTAGEAAPWAATASPPTSGPVAETALPPAAAPSVRRLARETGVSLTELSGSGRGGRILSEDVQRAQSNKQRSDDRTAIAVTEASPTNSRSAIASPRARRAAAELGVDWRQLTGTGARGRIRERDVRGAGISTSRSGTRRPISSRRQVITQRLVASRQQTVPVTLTTKADATNLVSLREQFKSVGGPSPVPSYQDLITKLVAEVLKRHLLLAGRWEGEAIVIPSERELHIGMAVDTDEGLLVPVLREVCAQSVTELAAQSRRMIERARQGTLTAAEMQGGVFTITNLGAFGIDAFTPVINLPEAAILGLGAIHREPVVLDDGQIVARSRLALSLTFDHRLIDGAPAARFLSDLVQAIENASAWLLTAQPVVV
jgi:pyruvate dehydrogenase E2 component (dihydrolipoamide acetyltransferase)